jgi:hypothetical protein
MKTRRHALVVTGIVTAVLLVPALIWSGMRSIGAETRGTFVKLPEVSTVGPEVIPYVLTPSERAKLALPANAPTIPLEDLYDRGTRAVVKSEGRYPGMTPAELEKLAAWQARVRELAASGRPSVTMPPASVPRGEPISTIEVVPRAPGIEGMTPEERAKAEGYRRKGGQK